MNFHLLLELASAGSLVRAVGPPLNTVPLAASITRLVLPVSSLETTSISQHRNLIDAVAIDAFLMRRDDLVTVFEKLAAERGRNKVSTR